MLNLHRSLLWLLMSLMLLASSFSAYHGTQHVFDVYGHSQDKHSHEKQGYEQHSFSFSPVYQLGYGLTENHERSYEPCDECLLLSNLHGVDSLTLKLGLSAQALPAAEPRQTDLPNRTGAAYFSRAPPATA